MGKLPAACLVVQRRRRTTSLTSFNTAVGVALDFAEKSGNTLVLVTGDHETGGLRISETKLGNARLEWSTSDHTAVAVPVFAYGPGAPAFAGFMDNTDVGRKLVDLAGRYVVGQYRYPDADAYIYSQMLASTGG